MRCLHIAPVQEFWTLANEGDGPLFKFDTKEEAAHYAGVYLHVWGGTLKILNADGAVVEEQLFIRQSPINSEDDIGPGITTGGATRRGAAAVIRFPQASGH